MKRRPIERVSLTGGLGVTITEMMLNAPGFRELRNVASIGIYFLLLAKSDPYGCLDAYPSVIAMKGHSLGGYADKCTQGEFKKAVDEMNRNGLLYFYEYSGRKVWFLPYKLPSAHLHYYPTPRLIPVSVVVRQLKYLCDHDDYLAQVVEKFKLERMDEWIVESGGLRHAILEDLPIPFLPQHRQRGKMTRKEITVEDIRRKAENLPPELQEEARRVFSDMRVITLQQYIRDNDFDIKLKDEQLLELIVKYGTEYTREMINEYGDWRLNKPKHAATHKSHYRGIINTWVHEKVTHKRLPNPNDQLTEIRWNVYLSPVELPAVKKYIAEKMYEKDEHNINEWLKTFADSVSAYKAKNGVTSTDLDANYILNRVDVHAKYSDRKGEKR